MLFLRLTALLKDDDVFDWFLFHIVIPLLSGWKTISFIS